MLMAGECRCEATNPSGGCCLGSIHRAIRMAQSGAAPVVARAEPAPATARAEPIAPPAPTVNVEKALQESGLVMIQTDPSKVKPATPEAEPQFVPPRPRPRRVPPPDTGPLQIVETRKDA